MTATAYSNGHRVIWDGQYWRYPDGTILASISRPCACCGHADVLTEVTILARLAHDGQQRRAVKGVDACIVDIVRALNDGGVITTSSCCGHGRSDGSILLADGREIIIRLPDGNQPSSAPSIAGGREDGTRTDR